MISINDLNYHIGDRNLFQNVSIQLPMAHRFAFVGRNGEGKTTLLRLIMGELTPSSGSINYSPKFRKGYLPQDLLPLADMTLSDYICKECNISKLEEKLQELAEKLKISTDVHRNSLLKQYARYQEEYEHIGAYSFHAKMKDIIMGLGFEEHDLKRSCNEFSGGWKMRIFLAQILLQNPDILLMDEPTNHLDTDSLEWLEDYLQSYKGLLIIVSHDRYFLDRIVNHTMEIKEGKITLFPGNYSHYLDEKQKRATQEDLEKEKILKQIRHNQTFIDRFRYKASKATQVQSKIKTVERLKKKCPIQEKEKRSLRVKLASSGRTHYETICMENVSHAYGDKVVFSNVDLTVYRGDRLALVGKNGAGKSTLTRLITGIEAPSHGNVVISENTNIGFFAQESILNLNYAHTIFQEMLSLNSPLNEQQLRTLLGAFLFSGDDIEKPVKILSGGEKSRLALCKILAQPFNVLVLDEPTNHLDEVTKQAVHHALASFDGTLILVSHDRYFLDQLVHRIVEIKKGQVSSYSGNYTNFIHQKTQNADDVDKSKHSKEDPGQIDKPRSLDKKRKREEALHRQELHILKKHSENLEKQIALLEEKKSKCQETFCDVSIYQNPDEIKKLKLEVKTLEFTLEDLYEQWNDSLEKIEDFGNKLENK